MNKQDLYQQLVGSKTGGGSSNPVKLSSREELYNSLINANKPSASNKVTVKKTIKKPQAVKKEAPKGIVNRLTDTVKYGAERFKASFPTLAGGLKVGSGVALDSIGKTITDGAFDERNKKIKIGGKEMTVREAIGKTAPSFIPSADPDPFRRAKIALEKKTGKDLNVTKKLKESGSKDYKRAQEASQKVIQKYGTPEKWTGKWLVGEIGGNAISTIGSVILGVATTAVTKNPVLGLSVGMSNTFMQESGSFYSQAKEEGASEADAQNGAVAVGTINSFIETIPLGRALSKFDSSGNIKKKLLSRISGFILKKVKNSTFEGSTETVQEIVSNAMKKTYKEDTKLFENTPESFAIGFSLGIIGDLTTDPITSNIEVVSPRKVEETNEIIDEALNTPKEERTPEQQQVVDSVNEKLDSMDVSEPQETVEEKDEKKATKVEETKAPADRADNVTKAPEPAKTIAKAETDPLITEARKYKSADEFMSNYKKVFHQTSPESAQAIEKEGFKTGIKGSGYGDFLPEGINTKSTGGEIPLRGRGMQIEAFFDSKSRVQRVKDRDGATRLIIENDKSGEYEKLLDEMDFIDNDAVRRVDALEKEFHDSRGATRVPGERDAYFKSRNIDLQKMLQEGSDKSDEVAQRAKKVATRVLRDMGVDVLHIEKDVGGWSGKLLTDNFIVLNPKALKTKSQLIDIWNQAQPTKGVDPLIEEARKYKSAEEFVKAQGQSVFRGGDTAIDTARGSGRGISVSDKETAGLFTPPEGGLVDEAILPKTAKILKEGDIPKNLQDAYIKEAQVLADPKNFSTALQKSVIEKQQAIIEYARKNGFDAVDFPFEKEIRVVKPNVLKTKSQLTDIWNKAQPTKGVDPLIQEARKYKSAEEFVNGNAKFVHETNAPDIREFDINKVGSGQGDSWLGKGVYLQESGSFKIESYGKNKIQAGLSPDAKIFEIKDTPNGKFRDNFVEWAVENDIGNARLQVAQREAEGLSLKNLLPRDILGNGGAVTEQVKKAGFDGLLQDGELVVYNPNVLKTKSQLTDIWNQAQTGTISEADKKDFEGMGLKVPEDTGGAKTTTIPEAEKQIQDTYVASQDKVDQAFSEVFTEMEIAEAGKRIFLDQPDSSQRKVVGVKSTFPDWIPEDLRSRKLFDAVMSGMSGDVTKLKFPDKNRTKQRQLYNAILAEVDKRSGVDTSEARSAILDLYEKPVQNKETKQAPKPTDRSSEGRKEATGTKQKELEEVKTFKNAEEFIASLSKEELASRAKKYKTPEEFIASFEEELNNIQFEELVDKQQAQAELDPEDIRIAENVSMENLREIFRRFFPNVAEFYKEDGIRNVDDYLENIDSETIAMEIDSDRIGNESFIRLLGDDELAWEMDKSNIIDLYKQKLLTPSLTKKAFNVKDQKFEDIPINRESKFYETSLPQQDADIKKIYEIATKYNIKPLVGGEGSPINASMSPDAKQLEIAKIKSKLAEIYNNNNTTKAPARSEQGLPVGQGRQKDSAFLERVKEQLLSTDPASYEFDEQTGKYNEMNLEENAQRATDFIVSNPKEAIAVSLGLINPPQGVTANAIGLGTMLKARDEKNFNLYRDIATSVTLRSTRLGQEIVSLRGQMNDNSPENFVKRAINARMKNISKSLLKDVEVAGRSLSDTKKEVTKKIDEETVKLKKKLSKDKIKIQKAQDIIDALRC